MILGRQVLQVLPGQFALALALPFTLGRRRIALLDLGRARRGLSAEVGGGRSRLLTWENTYFSIV